MQPNDHCACTHTHVHTYTLIYIYVHTNALPVTIWDGTKRQSATKRHTHTTKKTHSTQHTEHTTQDANVHIRSVRLGVCAICAHTSTSIIVGQDIMQSCGQRRTHTGCDTHAHTWYQKYRGSNCERAREKEREKVCGKEVQTDAQPGTHTHTHKASCFVWLVSLHFG
eukprot:GDKI01034376.1.p2 GENE.GDKI01034376.1~~GDKI01034376.1.p2  ORF type:complete len:167 (+),score=55.92 GDKI01034376.1:197-697(+)